MWHSDRPIEITMTHRVGADGVTSRCLRPAPILEIAQRVQRWTVTPEACQSCHSLPAVRFVDLPLCGRCHQQRAQRLGRTAASGLPAVVERVEDAPSPEKRLEGYAIRFNEKSVELFGFFEVIRPSAADRLMTEQPDLRALWNHDSAQPLGRTSAGTLRAEKRTAGVWVEIQPPRWATGHVESIDRRDVTGQSFGFMPLEDDWWLEDGMPHREILDMEVVEVSAVSFPAYPTTTIRAVNASARAGWQVEQDTAARLRLVR